MKVTKLDKITINNGEYKNIKQAVILAAGEKKIFGKPVSFLNLSPIK